jgi:hypothetical protein
LLDSRCGRLSTSTSTTGRKTGARLHTVRSAATEEGRVLPPFIIEQIRQREERERMRREEQPQLELPLQRPKPVRSRDDEDPDPDRGVVIVDLG